MDLPSWRLPCEFKAQQRSVRCESPSRLNGLEPRLNLQRSIGNLRIHAVQPNRPSQRSEVPHEICSGSGRQPETAVQQLVPNLCRGLMLRKADNLDVIHFSKCHISWQ